MSATLNTQRLKMIWHYANVYDVIWIIRFANTSKCFDKNSMLFCWEKCWSIWTHWWLGKFSETLLTEKEHFYSHISMLDIIDADYKHAKRVCKSEIKNKVNTMICMFKEIIASWW